MDKQGESQDNADQPHHGIAEVWKRLLEDHHLEERDYDDDRRKVSHCINDATDKRVQ